LSFQLSHSHFAILFICIINNKLGHTVSIASGRCRLKHKNISQRDGMPFAPILADVQTQKETQISEDDASAGASNTSAGHRNSHQPTRGREKVMRRFKSSRHLQRVASVHDQVANLHALPWLC
jgi:hypothetical protein